MTKRFYLGLALVVLVCTLALAPLKTADADDDTTLFINLTTDDPWAAAMALHYAGQVRTMGHRVVLFLNVRAVRLADKAIPESDAGADTKAVQATLREIVANGVTVFVCGMCTKKAGMTEADWIDGVKPGSRETIEIQMAASTKTMSY